MLSKVANWIVWSTLTLLVLVVFYNTTNWFKPAADLVINQAKAALNYVSPFNSANAADMLNQARDEYAKGDVDASVNTYKAYIQKYPSDSDAQGELGNVYYATGRPQEAAKMYFAAGDLLISQNQIDRALWLIPIIGQIDPAIANNLSDKIAQADRP